MDIDSGLESNVSIFSVSSLSTTLPVVSDTSTLSKTFSEPEVDLERKWESRVAEFRQLLETVRVLEERPPAAKNSHLPLYLKEFCVHSPNRFHHKFRIFSHIFDKLVHLIEDDATFQNNSIKPQFPV